MRMRVLAGFLVACALLGSHSVALGQSAPPQSTLSESAADALKAKRYQEAADQYRRLVLIDPKQWRSQRGLGDARYYLGQYDDALKSYDAAILLLRGAAPATLTPQQRDIEMSNAYFAEFNANAKLKRWTDATTAGEKGAMLSPYQGVAYFNLCAGYYNMGEMERALAVCDKSIALEPTRADAYIVKGSVMFGLGKPDADGKWRVAPGTIEALRKYLELAPDGGHRADAQAMIDSLAKPR